MITNLIPISLYPEHVIIWINYLQIHTVREKDYNADAMRFRDEGELKVIIVSDILMINGTCYTCKERASQINDLIIKGNL